MKTNTDPIGVPKTYVIGIPVSRLFIEENTNTNNQANKLTIGK